MGISINGPSGIDTQSIIDQLVALEKNKVTKVEAQKKAYQLKIDAFGKLNAYLNDVKSKASALSKSASFDLFSATTTNNNVVAITGATGSVDGAYDLRIFQAASNEKMISKNGLIKDQNASLSSQGITVGDISIGGTTLTIGATDTLQDLRMKINNATDSTGARLPVTASVIKVADDNFRMVLTAKSTGSAGVEYKDLTGSTLQNLGLITTPAGGKGNINQVIKSSADVATAFGALALGESIKFTGTDHNGSEVVGSFTKTATNTIDNFLKTVENSYHGMATVTTDGSGNMVVTDKISGGSLMSMKTLVVGTASIATAIATTGEQGAGILSTGKDAYFSVENVNLTSNSNTATGFISGVTINIKKASPDETITVGLSRDTAGIKKKFQDIVDAYNALVRFEKDSTKTKDPKVATSKGGDLAGDMTVGTIVSQARRAFQQQFNLLNTDLTSFIMLGLKTDTKTGEYSIDSDMFNKALETNFDKVVNLFTTGSKSSNTSVVYGNNTSDTTSGEYTVEEVDSNTLRIQIKGDTNWYNSDARTGDIVTFSNGPAKGLSLSAPSGAIGSGNQVAFTVSKGLSTVLSDLMTKLTDQHDGVVMMRQESLKKSIGYSDDRIDQLNNRIEKYRLRLVKQFSEMEKAMSTLQSQSSKMIGALGTNSNNS